MQIRSFTTGIVLAFASLGVFAGDSTPGSDWLHKVRVSGAVQTEFLVPYDFKGHMTGDYVKDVLNNTYFDLNINAPYISVGGRFEWTKWPLPGYDKDFGGWGVPFFWATGGYKCWQITAGDFYEQFGSGLILRLYQERSLGVDNAIRGGRFKITPAKGVHFTALAGRQRRYWEWNPSWIWGADAEWSLDESFRNYFGKDYGLQLGASYVGRHEKSDRLLLSGSQASQIPGYNPDKDYYLNFPETTAAFDGRVKLRARNLNVLFEFATKNNDPNYTNNNTYRQGNAFLLSADYASNGFTALIQAKRSENMNFRSKRGNDGNMISSFINNLPAFTMTQTYALAAMYPYSTQSNGEWAFQADIRYLFKKGTSLGGKYGTTVRLSASYISGLDYNIPDGKKISDRLPGSDEFGAPFWKIGELYYADLNFELNKKLSRSFQMTLFYLFQKYNQDIIVNHPFGMVTANTFVFEGQWKIAKKTQLRFEAQYLTAINDKGDWGSLLAELSLAPHWMITASDTYNFGESDNFYEILATYNYKANRFSLGYGKIREGYNCSGGVCRWVPQTEGFKVAYSYTF